MACSSINLLNRVARLPADSSEPFTETAISNFRDVSPLFTERGTVTMTTLDSTSWAFAVRHTSVSIRPSQYFLVSETQAKSIRCAASQTAAHHCSDVRALRK